MTRARPYPNAALTDICKQLLDDWKLTLLQISNLAKDIPGECDGILEGRATSKPTPAIIPLHVFDEAQ